MSIKNLITKLAGSVTRINIMIIAGWAGIDTEKAKAKTFVSEDGTKIIRTYENAQLDHIFVEDPKNPDNYITLNKHLDSYPQKYDREIEEAKIKKLVGW